MAHQVRTIAAPAESEAQITNLRSQLKELDLKGSMQVIRDARFLKGDPGVRHYLMARAVEEKADAAIRCEKLKFEETIRRMEEKHQMEMELLKQRHQEQLNAERYQCNLIMDARHLAVRNEADAEIGQVKEEARKMVQEVRDNCEKCMEREDREELAAEIEIPKFKAPVNEMFYHDYFEDPEESDDEGPEPTDDFDMVDGGVIKSQISAMSAMIAKLIEQVKKEDKDHVQEDKFSHEFSKEVLEAKTSEKQKTFKSQVELENEMCRLMDITFLESLI